MKAGHDKLTVCVDFDGVLNTYKGWRGEDELYEPRDDTALFLAHLADQYRVVVFTTRNCARVRTWLEKHGLYHYVAEVTSLKPPALAYVDDRAIQFNGDCGDVLVQLAGFRPHWER